MRRLVHLLPIAALWASQVSLAQEAITLHYYERPPYTVAQGDGSATGLTADVAAKVLTRAGIPFTWSLMPAKRQLAIIEHNTGRDCGIGWFRNPQREAFGTFSHPIYRDRPPVAIVRDGFEPQADSLAQLLQRPGVRVLVKEGLTYGGYINDLLKTAKAHVSPVTVEQPQLVRMIAAGRADIMFAPREEADVLVTRHESGPYSVHIVGFADVPAGDQRYLYCSKQVDSATMAKLNAAIDFIAP